MSQPIKSVISRQSIVLEVADLLKTLRLEKDLQQADLMDRFSALNRQTISRIENGRRATIDLGQLAEIVNACGEQLVIGTTYDNKKTLINSTKEDKVLSAFAEGRIEEADVLLEELRQWQYPAHQVTAKCKRNMAVHISNHFKGQTGQSHLLMNGIAMGLSMIDCDKEAQHFIEMYHRIINEGEENLSRRQALQREEDLKIDECSVKVLTSGEEMD